MIRSSRIHLNDQRVWLRQTNPALTISICCQYPMQVWVINSGGLLMRSEALTLWATAGQCCIIFPDLLSVWTVPSSIIPDSALLTCIESFWPAEEVLPPLLLTSFHSSFWSWLHFAKAGECCNVLNYVVLTGENFYFMYRFNKKNTAKFSTQHVPSYESHKSPLSLFLILVPM